MIRTAIVEDDGLYQERLSSYISRYGDEHNEKFDIDPVRYSGI